jgi:hypothetical protein
VITTKPDAPTGLVEVSRSNSTLRIKWSAALFTGGAKILDYRVISKQGTSYNELASGITETSYEVTDLTPDESYELLV